MSEVYFPEGHPDKEWNGELLRRVAGMLVWISDCTYDSLVREYQLTGNDECLSDMAEVEDVFSVLWPALLQDMEWGTRQ